MQWSVDRNAGFSRTEPGQLYGPVIAEAPYGYQAVNVEAQLRNPSSLLHWMRRLIAARKTSRVFGRGTLTFLAPGNTRVLAHVRDYQGETLLAVHNLAASSEPVELDLRAYRGAVPIEMLGDARFPPIGDQPYFLSLAPYGYFWFRLHRPETRMETYGIESTAI